MNIYLKSATFRICKRFLQTSHLKLKGHSKWQNIKHIKAANDLQRSILIAKQVKMISLAVRDGGGSTDPAMNNSLETAIEEALKRNVPKGTIQTTLKRLSESKGKEQSKRVLFEYRLYKKLMVIVSIFTDRSAHVRIQMATPMKKHLAEVINAKRLFIERGIFNVFARPNIDTDSLEDECLSDAIEFGAEDIEVHDIDKRQVSFFCDPNHFFRVKQKLTAAGYQIEYSECDFFPTIPLVELTDSEQADYKKFKERLMSIEGFDDIYDNLKENESE